MPCKHHFQGTERAFVGAALRPALPCPPPTRPLATRPPLSSAHCRFARCLPTGNVGHAHVGRGRRAPRGPCGRSLAPAGAREQIRDLEDARWQAAGPPGGLLARVPGRTRGPPGADCAPEPAGVLAKAGVRRPAARGGAAQHACKEAAPAQIWMVGAGPELSRTKRRYRNTCTHRNFEEINPRTGIPLRSRVRWASAGNYSKNLCIEQVLLTYSINFFVPARRFALQRRTYSLSRLSVRCSLVRLLDILCLAVVS